MNLPSSLLRTSEKRSLDAASNPLRQTKMLRVLIR